MKVTGWAFALVPTGVLFLVAYVCRLIFGGVAAGAGHVATHLRFAAMPFAYCLKRAKGFRRIHGAWVKPRPTNRRQATLYRKGH